MGGGCSCLLQTAQSGARASSRRTAVFQESLWETVRAKGSPTWEHPTRLLLFSPPRACDRGYAAAYAPLLPFVPLVLSWKEDILILSIFFHPFLNLALHKPHYNNSHKTLSEINISTTIL